MDTRYCLKANALFEFLITENQLDVLDFHKISTNNYHLLYHNKSIAAQIISSDFNDKTYTVKINSNRYKIQIETPLDELIQKMGLEMGNTLSINDIKAPMPGLILEVLVKPNDIVKEGDYLLVLEAMKMENALTAPRDGIVKNIEVAKGEAVDKGQLLIEME